MLDTLQTFEYFKNVKNVTFLTFFNVTFFTFSTFLNGIKRYKIRLMAPLRGGPELRVHAAVRAGAGGPGGARR